MKSIGWIGLGLSVAFACIWASVSRESYFEDVQAVADRETVDCLVNSLSREEKLRIAQFTDTGDRDSRRSILNNAFPKCAVRGDQEQRKTVLMGIAFRTLAADPEFKAVQLADRTGEAASLSNSVRK